MFKDLVKTIVTLGGYSQAAAGAALGYKTPSSFQRVTTGADMRLTVLYNICKLCGFDIVITNNNGITISIADYMNNNQTD